MLEQYPKVVGGAAEAASKDCRQVAALPVFRYRRAHVSVLSPLTTNKFLTRALPVTDTPSKAPTPCAIGLTVLSSPKVAAACEALISSVTCVGTPTLTFVLHESPSPAAHGSSSSACPLRSHPSPPKCRSKTEANTPSCASTFTVPRDSETISTSNSTRIVWVADDACTVSSTTSRVPSRPLVLASPNPRRSACKTKLPSQGRKDDGDSGFKSPPATAHRYCPPPSPPVRLNVPRRQLSSETVEGSSLSHWKICTPARDVPTLTQGSSPHTSRHASGLSLSSTFLHMSAASLSPTKIPEACRSLSARRWHPTRSDSSTASTGVTPLRATAVSDAHWSTNGDNSCTVVLTPQKTSFPARSISPSVACPLISHE